MKITICGSLAFAEKILEIEKELQALGHSTLIPLDTHVFLNEGAVNDWTGQPDFGREGMLGHYENIAISDAILVVNFDKNGVKGYVGGSTLIETGIAAHLKKKIFLLNEIPSEDDLRYAQEIKLLLPIIINGDLSKII